MVVTNGGRIPGSNLGSPRTEPVTGRFFRERRMELDSIPARDLEAMPIAGPCPNSTTKFSTFQHIGRCMDGTAIRCFPSRNRFWIRFWSRFANSTPMAHH